MGKTLLSPYESTPIRSPLLPPTIRGRGAAGHVPELPQKNASFSGPREYRPKRSSSTATRCSAAFSSHD